MEKTPWNAPVTAPYHWYVEISNYMLKLLLDKVMDKLIHFDKRGFITVLSLDTEKAFDRLEWPNLWAVMKNLRFGLRCLSIRQILYENPLASVITDICQSSPYFLFKN